MGEHSSLLPAFCSPGLGDGKPSLLGQASRAAVPDLAARWDGDVEVKVW